MTVNPLTIMGTQVENFPHLYTSYLEEHSIQTRDTSQQIGHGL